MKARLLRFLYTLREDHPDYLVKIQTAGDEREVETEKEFDLFASDLAGMKFLPDSRPVPGTAMEAGELFVFSSSYDPGLGTFLGLRGDRVTNLYFTVDLGSRLREKQDRPAAEILSARDLFRQELLPLPGLFHRRQAGPQNPVRPFRGSLEVEYAGVLP